MTVQNTQSSIECWKAASWVNILIYFKKSKTSYRNSNDMQNKKNEMLNEAKDKEKW